MHFCERTSIPRIHKIHCTRVDFSKKNVLKLFVYFLRRSTRSICKFLVCALRANITPSRPAPARSVPLPVSSTVSIRRRGADKLNFPDTMNDFKKKFTHEPRSRRQSPIIHLDKTQLQYHNKKPKTPAEKKNLPFFVSRNKRNMDTPNEAWSVCIFFVCSRRGACCVCVSLGCPARTSTERGLDARLSVRLG